MRDARRTRSRNQPISQVRSGLAASPCVRTCMRTLASAAAYTIRKMEINRAVSRRILIGVIGVTVCSIPIGKILYLE